LTIRVSTQDGKTLTVVRIEGRLTSDDVPDVRGACESAKPPLRLDLSGLRSADPDGIRLLRSLSEAGAELHGANSYIRQLLIQTNT
jgi:anti-anti-sigma regulatory factor